ncbi:phage host specificity protein [Jannaschia pagri]|uniref:Phage host specificity protein n=1 Tax=Jannaschia pagri TaxID=2829797 RepID=A0ABQ4NMN8_9RHOB|nr:MULTISPECIES: glycoside hydrolase TIM-barrel-like domain-containing protein [unclassified Jannaschia]GIT91827.1 phage host specificity protein [Jannaschia sp. AI_61]GIT95661.1 phage host specificity protein [Jannaschia sp. AI_62]
MATLVLGAAGAAIGGSLGGSVLGLSAAVVGRAAGATLGRVLDQQIMGAGAEAIEHGRVDRFRLTGASEGAAIPRVVGRVRLGGQVIWATRFKETRTTSGGSGKGGPKAPQTTSFTYSVSVALALCEGRVTRVGRVWADGNEIARDSIHMRVYDGSEDQQPDALIEAVEGIGAAPAYRGISYVVIEDLDLTPFGNRLPQLSFEVVRAPDTDELDVADLVEGVALMPGTGEYALATTPVHYDHGAGGKDSANVNTLQDMPDVSVSLRDLQEELPNVTSASLIVSWFGDDLRCGQCTIRPRAEQDETDGTPQPWTVSGMTRETAGVVPTLEDRPVYGGTPGDASVVEIIRDMTARGLDVTFYPFILMDQLAGNGLPDPWGEDEQAVLPWRGRITTDIAPGRDGTTDRTVAADAEVAAFFGTVSPGDFAINDGTVSYSGPDEFSYRRFILHYAALCAAAGGVEAFCIGSEMRSLTQIRGADDTFPAVGAMIALLEDVRLLLPGAKLGYAADWSEYFGYHPVDTGNVHFHLDRLWSHPALDFIGIDNYMPLSDWRDGLNHADAAWGDGRSLPYLMANVEGGEGYDWYYPTQEARDAQRRVPITDGLAQEPWVYRYKDLKSWWLNPHHDRIDGQRLSTPTAWLPQSKPIRFTEYGCAAIDKGANQPNKFLDPKSSESSLPFYSNGRRDDAMQAQYLRAILGYWRDPDRNPVSEEFGGRMLDLPHSLAWAWDARPWPAFPDLRSFWTDGENYGRGHWINGRSGNQSLASVIVEICQSAGLGPVDVSEVYGVVRGYTVTSVQSARADLQPLLLAYGIEVIERSGTLQFSMRENAKEVSIAESMLVRDGTKPVVSVQRAPEAEVAGRVRVHHVDAGGDFAPRTGDAVHPGEDALPITDSELPLSLTAGEGHALAERYLAEARIARDTLELALPPSSRDVRVGDLMRVGDADDTWRIDRIEDAGQRRVEAVRAETSVFDPSDAVEDGSGKSRPAAALPVQSVFLDLPLLTGQEVPHAPHVAVSARPWPGSVAIHSSVEDAGYRLNTVIDTPATLGVTETVLERAQAGLWDRGPDLVVRLQGPPLESKSRTAILSGANAMAIGNGSIGGWEIFQFQDAQLIEPGVWALRQRLRGQRGTDAVIPDVWPIGSTVVLLDGAAEQIDLATDALGLPRHYRIGSARLGVDHPSYVYRVETAIGEGLRPYAPAHLRAILDQDGFRLTWVRRSRAVGEAWDAADVPLLESVERYEVRVRDAGGVLLRDWQQSDTEFALSPTEAADVGVGSGPTIWEVAQVSDVFGPGHFSRLLLN